MPDTNMVMMTHEAVTDAFDDAYRRWYPDVFRYVRRRVDDDAAADVVADVFTVAWRRRDRLAAADEQLAWLYGVARRCVANARRSRSRRRALVDRAASTERTAVPDGTSEVIDALGRLSGGDREVLTLVAWEGLTGPELAVALDVSEATARKRLSRARGRLAAALEGGS